MTEHQKDRTRRVLAQMRQAPLQPVKTGTVCDWYRDWGIAPNRTTVRKDLNSLTAHGLLRARGPENEREFLLAAGAA